MTQDTDFMLSCLICKVDRLSAIYKDLIWTSTLWFMLFVLKCFYLSCSEGSKPKGFQSFLQCLNGLVVLVQGPSFSGCRHSLVPSSSSSVAVSRTNLPSCFSVAGFNGLTIWKSGQEVKGTVFSCHPFVDSFPEEGLFGGCLYDSGRFLHIWSCIRTSCALPKAVFLF